MSRTRMERCNACATDEERTRRNNGSHETRSWLAERLTMCSYPDDLNVFFRPTPSPAPAPATTPPAPCRHWPSGEESLDSTIKSC